MWCGFKKVFDVFLDKILGKALIASLVLSLPIQMVPCPSNAAVAAADPGVSNSEIVIGSCCALSGRMLGIQQLDGASAYINDVNDKGGVNSRKITIKRFDNGYEPAKAESAFKQLQQAKCFAGAFFVGTPPAKVYVPLAEQSKTPIVGFFSGAQLLHEPFRPYAISVRASYFDEIRDQIDHMFKTWHAICRYHLPK